MSKSSALLWSAPWRIGTETKLRIIRIAKTLAEEWKKHFAWNKDATKILGLTAEGRATIEALKMNRLELIRVRRMWVKMGEHPPSFELEK